MNGITGRYDTVSAAVLEGLGENGLAFTILTTATHGYAVALERFPGDEFYALTLLKHVIGKEKTEELFTVNFADVPVEQAKKVFEAILIHLRDEELVLEDRAGWEREAAALATSEITLFKPV